jgi:ABC-2 type transport system permease protein
MKRYLRLLLIQIRASALLSMQYRLDFVVDALMGVFWTGASLVPLLVLFSRRSSFAGWTWPEALLVVACFTILKGLIDGAIQPSLTCVIDHVRKGTLDFLLMKPVDAQFMVSTSRFDLWRGTDAIGGLALLVWALRRLGHSPSVAGVVFAVILLIGAVVILYSLWILVVSLAFFVVKVGNLSNLFTSVYDFARWPSTMFRGALGFVFTFVIPLGVMTTFPALAMLDRLEPLRAASGVAAAIALACTARAVWLRCLRYYVGAGG